MSDRARDVWVEHLVTTYMNMSQPDWNHLCAVLIRAAPRCSRYELAAVGMSTKLTCPMTVCSFTTYVCVLTLLRVLQSNVAADVSSVNAVRPARGPQDGGQEEPGDPPDARDRGGAGGHVQSVR